MAENANWWTKPRNVSICVDTPGWFDDFAADLAARISAGGDRAKLMRDASEVQDGGVAFYLSCTKLTPREKLARNHKNIVVHASAFPEGRGFSPIVWQVLEGRNLIPITMILAAEEADSGNVLSRDEIMLNGTELNDEIRHVLGRNIQQMCLDYLARPEPSPGEQQSGDASWYRRRSAEDSRLDPHRTIAEQFELLRVVDNERYPAFFDFRNRRYVVRIEALPMDADLSGKAGD
jgi:methionyl-tRNA formyltransferase